MSSRLHSVLAAAALPIILSFCLVALSMACAVAAAGELPAGAAPAAGAQVPCRHQLAASSPPSSPAGPASARLGSMGRSHVRVGPARHNPDHPAGHGLAPPASPRTPPTTNLMRYSNVH